MTKFKLYLLIFLIVFNILVFTLCPLHFAKTFDITYLEACRELYIKGLFGTFKRDFKKGFKGFCSEIKKVAKVLYDGVCAFIEWCKPPKEKHIYKEELDVGLRMVVADYTYAPMVPDIVYHYDQPSHIGIRLYCKSEVTPEVSQELVWHCSAVYQRYLECNGLPFEYTVIPNVVDNKIELNIFYCEYPEEYPMYSMACRQATYLNVERTCQPLPEQLEVKGRGVVLGYDYDKWQSSGRVTPEFWDMKSAPHMLVSGATGGGKTVFVKKALEQVLSSGAAVTICDFKGFGDYKSFRGDYAIGTQCDSMLSKFCEDFEVARQKGIKTTEKFLIFDEFGSYSASKSKKEYEELMSMLSGVIFMGRSYGYHIILISQRFDADTLRTSLREQFGVKVYMGASISQQSATILFVNSELDKSKRLDPYCGYISTPKTDLKVIITPKVDIQALDRRIEQLSSKS